MICPASALADTRRAAFRPTKAETIASPVYGDEHANDSGSRATHRMRRWIGATSLRHARTPIDRPRPRTRFVALASIA
ncbi:hypothetical protein D1006_33770 [Burkholderia stabilis]|uniref:Uncharacterized protein n=1 Tax=Burkholderia stabilis TaxID=95485 RepID=A0A4Q2A7V7_9BURK|nr:hypothetical protein D1006_33770 [Burkholderia stabilis]